MKKIMLASQSPRRSQLLAQCGIPHTILETDNDPIEAAAPPHGPDIAAWVEAAALAKLRAAAAGCEETDAIIISADTIVAINGAILGKPSSENDARLMLKSLSGVEHTVITAVALMDTTDNREIVFNEKTAVEFFDLTGLEIDRYIATGEPMDKAGAYGIQGLAGAFIRKVTGCHSNVVGLPMARLAVVLKTEFGFDITIGW